MAIPAHTAAPHAEEWIEVESTCLSRIRVRGGQYATSVTLTVEFHSGRRYTARGVPHSLVSDLLLAGSIGEFYNRNLREAFRWVRA